MTDSKINQKFARNYWQAVEPDVDGMMGGFAHISNIDLQSSKIFLSKLGFEMENKVGMINRAVDCGAGIGRITEGLLLGLAKTVDIVEPISKFSDFLMGKKGIGLIFNVGLEEWSPTFKYDLVWNQWCLGYLTDSQLLVHLKNCTEMLTDGGLIIVKENLSTIQNDVFDDDDSSITRTDEKFLKLFELSGLKVEKSEIQKGFPKELYPVKIYALTSKSLN